MLYADKIDINNCEIEHSVLIDVELSIVEEGKERILKDKVIITNHDDLKNLIDELDGTLNKIYNIKTVNNGTIEIGIINTADLDYFIKQQKTEGKMYDM